MNMNFDEHKKALDILTSTPAIWGDSVGTESRKTWRKKMFGDFFVKYMLGKGLDIGGTGYLQDVKPILPTAIIVDLDYPKYNGKILPFEDNSQDYVYSSHCLEHISEPHEAICEWFRVTKPGGFIIIVVPHKWLYERKICPPSIWNEDHKRFYEASDLITEIEDSLVTNSYRIRHLKENDEGHTYGVPVEIHANGCYEIEVVIEKL